MTGSSPPRREGVLLLHGLGLAVQGTSMRPLSARLKRRGFETACLDYPSYRLGLDEALDDLSPRAAEASAEWDVCHIVGHSLGGVIGVRLSADLPERRLGRVVQIGSPNLGSPLAALAAKVPPARRTLGPMLDALSSPLPPHGALGVGAIAGRTSWGAAARLPGQWGQGFTGDSDGKVAVESALAFAADRAIVPVGHAFLPGSRRVADAVVRYLREGRFPDDIRVEAEDAPATQDHA